MRNIHATLIILEDEVAHSEAIRRSLITPNNGCNIIVAQSMREFNNIVLHTQPDLVIADMNLPDGNALSLLKGSLDSQPWPVLVMTSYGDEELAVKALKSGALDYIVKSPETFRNISHVVNRNLRDWRNYKKGKKIEADLRESEKKFRSLFETMAQGVVYQNASGYIFEANPAAQKLLGLTLDQMQGRASADPRWKAIQEDGSDFPGEEHPAILSLKSGKPVMDKVMGVYNPVEESYRWIMVNAIPQFRENESLPYQVFTTFSDISDLKKAEEALQKQNVELKHAKEKAEESDKLKSAFMANMSHEIRTPMNGILGFADLLKTPNLSGESQQKYIEIIELSGRRMLEIINDLIDISKIEAGQVEIKSEPFKLKALCDELFEFFKPEADARGIQLIANLQLPSVAYLLNSDRIKLAQVITNLIKNALKFTGSGGRIEVGCRLENENMLYIYVRDNGVGIRKELQDKIFERFRQGDKSETEIHEGVGLGLSISKAFVEMLGGTIGLESEVGEGSEFFIKLPIVGTQESIEESDLKGKGETSLPCINVLIAEDDEPSYVFLNEVFKRQNISTYHATNGKEAVDILKSHPDINLVLMDIKMPVMNGLEATEEIKKIKKEIPVIAQSAFVTDTDIQNAIEAGCNDYITKPIQIKTLLDKIAAYCKF